MRSHGFVSPRIWAQPLSPDGRTLVFADAPEWRETIATVFARDAPAPADQLTKLVNTAAFYQRLGRLAAAPGGLGEKPQPPLSTPLKEGLGGEAPGRTTLSSHACWAP